VKRKKQTAENEKKDGGESKPFGAQPE